jgi:hypothetical protein
MNPAPADNAPVPHHIAGRRLAFGPVLPVHNPANGQILRWVHVAEGPQIVQALASARSAQPAWAALPPDARVQVLARLQRRAEDDQDLLRTLLVQELGLTHSEARAEMQDGLAQLAAAGAAPAWLDGPHQAQAGAGLEQWTQVQPLGVVAGVLPFCCPWSLLMGLAPWALAAGNAFIAKPSPHTPSLAVWLAEALLACGLAPWPVPGAAGRRRDRPGPVAPPGRGGPERGRAQQHGARVARRRGGAGQTGAGAGRRQEPPGGAARRRPGARRRRHRAGRLRRRRAALRGGLGPGAGGACRRGPDATCSASACGACASATRHVPTAIWGP